jgi:hypothetical protein
MCPVDLKRTLGEKTHIYVVGPATLKGYRLGFIAILASQLWGTRYHQRPTASVEGVLYKLPWRLSDRLTSGKAVHQNCTDTNA